MQREAGNENSFSLPGLCNHNLSENKKRIFMGNGYAIDSMTVLIYEPLVLIKNKALSARVIVVDVETGEQYGNPRDNTDVKVCNVGFNTSYKAQKIARGTYSEPKKYISFTLNSKHLKSRYFEGITKETIRIAYEQIISEGVIEFSFKDMLESIVWDVDIRKDFTAEDFKVTEFKEAVGKLNQALKPEYEKIAKPFRSKKNQGFQVSTRDSANNPLYKLYNKKVELEVNSKDFWQAHLGCCNVEKEYRIELTFKRRTQMAALGLLHEDELNTLENLLEAVDRDSVSHAFRKVQGKYFVGLEHYEMRQKLLAENDKILRKVNTTIYWVLKNTKEELNLETIIRIVLEIHEPSKNLKNKFVIAATNGYYAHMQMLEDSVEHFDLKLW